MLIRNLLVGCCLTAATIAAPLSSASAGPWHRHRCWFIGCVFDAAGDVVVGAATIATAPLAIVADAADGGRDYGPPQGYAAAGYGGPVIYGPPRYYRYPRRYYYRRTWYGPRPAY
jgi:hypothetical protein